MNAASFCGFIDHLFGWTYAHSLAQTSGSLSNMKTFTLWSCSDSGSSQCLIQSHTHSHTQCAPYSLAYPCAIWDASITLWPFFTTICKWFCIACIITTQYVTPENNCSNLQQHHACAITKTIAWIKIVKQHKRTSWLQSITCQRKSRGIKGVEELNRVYVRVVTIDLVYAHMNGLFSRESKKIRLSWWTELISGLTYLSRII